MVVAINVFFALIFRKFNFAFVAIAAMLLSANYFLHLQNLTTSSEGFATSLRWILLSFVIGITSLICWRDSKARSKMHGFQFFNSKNPNEYFYNIVLISVVFAVVATEYCFSFLNQPYATESATLYSFSSLTLCALLTGKVILQESVAARMNASSWLEAQQTQKIAAIGEITGFIAHEVKNPLAAICYATEIQHHFLGEESLSDIDQIRKQNKMIQRAADQIQNTLNSLNSFASQPHAGPGARVSVKQIVQKSVNLFTIQPKQHSVNLTILPIDENLRIHCQETEICLALLNLINNSFEGFVDQEKPAISLEVKESEQEVIFYVHDNGPGIPDRIKKQILNPFFITQKKGTGLGLQICQNILARIDRKLGFESGNGVTSFYFSIPKSQKT